MLMVPTSLGAACWSENPVLGCYRRYRITEKLPNVRIKGVNSEHALCGK